MAEARAAMQKTYGGDILSHPEQNVVNYDAKTRYNNNVRSSVLNTNPDFEKSKVLEKERNAHFRENPIKATATRASYQDSNIFGANDPSRGTVQPGCIAADRDQRVRNNNTFNSAIFGGAEATGPASREQNTFKSAIFAEPKIDPATRKKLGGESSGTATLFGEDKTEYQKSSSNNMISKVSKSFEPKFNNQHAASRKDAELHGQTAQVYGGSKYRKKDDALQANGADWKNTGSNGQLRSSPTKKAATEGDIKTKKYQQLQSSVFGGGYQNGEPPQFDREASKAAFSSAADWKTAGGMAKPINVGPSKENTYLQRQKQLASAGGIFEQTDYTGYMPMKKTPLDVDNFGHENKSIPKGRKTGDEDFKSRVATFDPPKTDYNPSGMKTGMLSSVFDKPVTVSAPVQQEEAPVTYAIPGRDTAATKQAHLGSTCPITGKSSLAAYGAVQAKPEVVDLTINGLPEHMDARELKKASGAKHVISSTVDEDNMKGVCLGTGRIKIRLNQGETLDSITLNLVKNGWTVNEYTQDPRKQPNLTGVPKEKKTPAQNAKAQKQAFLSSQMPEATGNSGAYQVNY